MPTYRTFRTFLDRLTGHRAYLWAAPFVVTACVAVVRGHFDAGDFALVIGAIAAFVGTQEVTGAVRAKATPNGPATRTAPANSDQ